MKNYTNLEQSQKLKNSGFPQDKATYYFVKGCVSGTWHILDAGIKVDGNEPTGIFCAGEIMDAMKDDILKIWYMDDGWCVIRINATSWECNSDLIAVLVEAYIKQKELK